MALDSWKKIKRLEQDIKDIFSSHGQNPITMDFVDAYIECFSGEFQQNYLKDKPFSLTVPMRVRTCRLKMSQGVNFG